MRRRAEPESHLVNNVSDVGHSPKDQFSFPMNGWIPNTKGRVNDCIRKTSPLGDRPPDRQCLGSMSLAPIRDSPARSLIELSPLPLPLADYTGLIEGNHSNAQRMVRSAHLANPLLATKISFALSYLAADKVERRELVCARARTEIHAD